MMSCHEAENVEDEYHHDKIYFENNSDKDITAMYRIERRNPDGSVTMIFPRNGNEIHIESNTEVNLNFGENLTGDICEYIIGSDTLIVEILEDDFEPKGDAVAYCLASYHFSGVDLHDLDCHLAYPPTEKMLKYNVIIENEYWY